MRKIISLLAFLVCVSAHGQAIFFGTNFNTATAASTPTFSPVAGTYTGTQTVTISASTGPVICYNTTGSPATNGTTGCTTGTKYTTPVSVASSETLYAVAGGTGYSDSSVGSAAYTINPGNSYVNSGAYGPFTIASSSFGAQSIWSVGTGNFLVVAWSVYAGSTGLCTSGGVVANPGSYSMTQLLNGYVSTRGSVCVFYLDNTPSGINSITVNTGPSNNGSMGSFVAAEFSGLSTTAAANGTPLNTLSGFQSGGTWTTTSSTTTTGGPSLCLAGDVITGRNNQTSMSNGSGWTGGPVYLQNTSGPPGAYLEYQLNASAGSYTGTGGYAPTSTSGYDNAWVGCVK